MNQTKIKKIKQANNNLEILNIQNFNSEKKKKKNKNLTIPEKLSGTTRNCFPVVHGIAFRNGKKFSPPCGFYFR